MTFLFWRYWPNDFTINIILITFVSFCMTVTRVTWTFQLTSKIWSDSPDKLVDNICNSGLNSFLETYHRLVMPHEKHNALHFHASNIEPKHLSCMHSQVTCISSIPTFQLIKNLLSHFIMFNWLIQLPSAIFPGISYTLQTNGLNLMIFYFESYRRLFFFINYSLFPFYGQFFLRIFLF